MIETGPSIPQPNPATTLAGRAAIEATKQQLRRRGLKPQSFAMRKIVALANEVRLLSRQPSPAGRPLLGFLRLRWQLQHRCLLAFYQGCQKNDFAVWKSQRIVMGGPLVLVDLSEDRGPVADHRFVPWAQPLGQLCRSGLATHAISAIGDVVTIGGVVAQPDDNRISMAVEHNAEIHRHTDITGTMLRSMTPRSRLSNITK